ncbi:hypothetical protein ACFOGI_03120 [Virgibacillus xinjiangensis]|uniref:Uncharacterized protein n=1 Tax=Virgibacillus xinjiangensis TaxID=393090 RepID=A0ABV7CSK9_9BACI
MAGIGRAYSIQPPANAVLSRLDAVFSIASKVYLSNRISGG